MGLQKKVAAGLLPARRHLIFSNLNLYARSNAMSCSLIIFRMLINA